MTVGARSTPIYLFLVVGLFGGLASGLAGIGGGVVLVPLMVGALAVSQHMAQGSSLVIIIPTAIVSGLVYLLVSPVAGSAPTPGVDPVLLIALYALPAMLAAPVGAIMTKRLNAAQLKRLFGILIIGVAFRLILPRPVGDILIAIAMVTLVATLVMMLRRGEAIVVPD